VSNQESEGLNRIAKVISWVLVAFWGAVTAAIYFEGDLGGDGFIRLVVFMTVGYLLPQVCLKVYYFVREGFQQDKNDQ
jgi:hypothetical protein